MSAIEGSCHCGAVRIRVDEAPTQLTACNCSICRRLGWQLAYYREAQVTVEAAEDAVHDYVWGDRLLAFKRCATCGCATHWEGIGPDRKDRMGVNMRLFDPADLEGVVVRRWDGADTWTWLD